MKMHSYMTINGYLQYVSKQSQKKLDQLRGAVTEFSSSWDDAIASAKIDRAALDVAQPGSNFASSVEFTPTTTPGIERDGGTTIQYTDASTANALRKRLAAISADNSSGLSTPSIEQSEYLPPVATSQKSTQRQGPAMPHPLVDHPEERISALAKEYSDLEGELTSSGPYYVRWPNNINLRNFTVYQLIPTLVYELEYPRTDRYAISSSDLFFFGVEVTRLTSLCVG